MSRAKARGNAKVRILGYGHTLNLGICKQCGTSNPTMPGEGLAEKCSGCGSEIEHFGNRTVNATNFTPPKKVDKEVEIDTAIQRRDNKRMAKNMRNMEYDSAMPGVKKPGDRKVAYGHKRGRN